MNQISYNLDLDRPEFQTPAGFLKSINGQIWRSSHISRPKIRLPKLISEFLFVQGRVLINPSMHFFKMLLTAVVFKTLLELQIQDFLVFSYQFDFGI
jgi:hypothetical protein